MSGCRQAHTISNLAGNLSYIFGIILWATSWEYIRRHYFEVSGCCAACLVCIQSFISLACCRCVPACNRVRLPACWSTLPSKAALCLSCNTAFRALLTMPLVMAWKDLCHLECCLVQVFYRLHIVGFLGFVAFGWVHFNGFWYAAELTLSWPQIEAIIYGCQMHRQQAESSGSAFCTAEFRRLCIQALSECSAWRSVDLPLPCRAYCAPALVLYFLDLTFRVAQWMNVSIGGPLLPRSLPLLPFRLGLSKAHHIACSTGACQHLVPCRP